MKRIVVISTMLSIVVLILTINIWLIFKPLNFKMNVCSNKQDKPIQISVLLDRKDESDYIKSYNEDIMIDLKSTNHCNITFKNKTPAKRFKLVLENIIPNTEYILSEISFKSGRKQIKIEDLSLFFSKDAKLKIKDNSLIVLPDNNTATLEYNKLLNIKRSAKFDIKMFLIIGILSYLLFYKLFSYLADFKINKNISRLDIIFLVICTIIAIIPISDINQNDISKKENRTLTKYNPLFDEDHNLNFNYGKDYEAWFNDRFRYRDILIDLFQTFQFYIVKRYYKTEQAYLDKKTNWEFNIGAGYCLKEKSFDRIKQEKINEELNKFNKFCKENNIELYLLIVPNKVNLYSQNTYIKSIKDDTQQSINSIIKNTNIPVIYPFDELKKESLNDYVYFKTDHHWTDIGAFIGYQALMKEIKKDYPNIRIVNKSDFNITQNKLVRSEWDRDFHIGHTSFFALNLAPKAANKILDTYYKYYTHKDSKIITISITDIPNLKQKDFHYSKGSNINAIIIGTSMNENLNEILPYTFQNTRYLRLNNVTDVLTDDEFKIMKRLEQNILNYKPDIMILCITADNISDLKNINNKE